MAIMWFLVLFLSTVAADQRVWDQIENHLNSSFDPCDNFYDHVCANVVDGNQKETILKQRLKDVKHNVEAFMPPTYYRLLAKIVYGNNIDVLKELCQGKECETHYTEYRNQMRNFANNITNLAHVVAYGNYIKNNSKMHEQSLFNVRLMFETLKMSIQRSLEVSTSLKKENRTDFFVEKLRKIKLLEVNDHPSFHTALDSIEGYFNECMLNKTDAEKLMFRAICAYTSFERSYDIVPRDIKHMHGIKEILKMDAHYSRDTNTIYMAPLFYPTQFDFWTMLSTTGSVIAHEISHSIFGSKDVQPVYKECLTKAMEESCQLFVGELSSYAFNVNRYIHNELMIVNAYNKVDLKCSSGIMTSSEDGPDWAATRAVLDLIDTMLHGDLPVQIPNFENTRNLTNYKLFFYSQAALLCWAERNHSTNVHSSMFIRINGQFRQFQEFQETFQCREGSRMVVTQQDRCYVIGVRSKKSSNH